MPLGQQNKLEESDKVNPNKMSVKSEVAKSEVVKCEKENKTQRTTVRGKAALLLDSSSCESDEEGGIYGTMIKTTKQVLKVTKNKFMKAENKIIEKYENDVTKNISVGDEDSSDDSTSFECDDNDNNSNYHQNALRKSLNKTPTQTPNKSLSSCSPSPPPPPNPSKKKKRKSTTVVEKNLREWEKLKSKTLSAKAQLDNSALDCDQSIVEEVSNNLTLRILTKMGLQRIETKTDQEFLVVYEEIAKLDNTEIENLILMHKEKKIEHADTPSSLNILFTDFIECTYIKAKVHGRIEVVEKDGEETPRNMTSVILQTSDGRKSRVKFNIAKDEPLNNLLELYCEKLELGNSGCYILEFDGDVVSATETSVDIDLDGDEIFDVKKSKKPTMQLVKENKKNYEFDADILPC